MFFSYGFKILTKIYGYKNLWLFDQSKFLNNLWNIEYYVYDNPKGFTGYWQKTDVYENL